MYIAIGIIFVLLIIYKAFLPDIKGWAGEKTVSVMLSNLPSDSYTLLNNVLLHSEKGTSQIDHVIVSIYGIFVIETKNYKGWITGSENGDQWTKNMYGKKYKFKNPIKQNYGHVMALSKLLNYPKEYFIPIVVFSLNADLKVKTNSPVVYTKHLKKLILSYHERCFSKEELAEITARIGNANIDSKDTRRQHVQSIQKQIIDDKNTVKNGICPRCGAKLVQRHGKFGDFMGCSQYPKCHYTN